MTLSDHRAVSRLICALCETRSSVVEKVLLLAHEERKSFSVYVVDSRPMLEGSVWYFPSTLQRFRPFQTEPCTLELGPPSFR